MRGTLFNLALLALLVLSLSPAFADDDDNLTFQQRDDQRHQDFWNRMQQQRMQDERRNSTCVSTQIGGSVVTRCY